MYSRYKIRYFSTRSDGSIAHDGCLSPLVYIKTLGNYIFLTFFNSFTRVYLIQICIPVIYRDMVDLRLTVDFSNGERIYA